VRERKKAMTMNRKARKEWLNRRWDTERGIWMTDYNNCLVLVRASVEDVCRSLKGYTARCERDVLGGEISLAEEGFFIFRLRGHDWTEVLHNDSHYPCQYPFTERWAKLSSRRLSTRAIFYYVSDTCPSIGYSLFENGQPLEAFDAVEGEPWKFRSKVRALPPKGVGDRWGFVKQFFVDQDAFDPFFTFTYFLGHREARPGDCVIVQNPGHDLAGVGVSRPGLERVTYLELRPTHRARRGLTRARARNP
jgi:hypothetical protein